jgi:hypothetical protein
MRAKEFKKFLNNIPDDTEILIRCQLHEDSPPGLKETVKVVSITPQLNDYKRQVILNAEKVVRLAAYLPHPADLVSCETCTNASRISTCVKKGRDCDACRATCNCKDCGHHNIGIAEPYERKPNYEKNVKNIK